MAEEDATPAARRHLPEPALAGDGGTPDRALTSALAAYAGAPERSLEVVLALQNARLLVPVVPVLGDVEHEHEDDEHDEHDGHDEHEETQLTRKKTSDMATALLTGQDGRLALLAFTGLDALAAWRPDARPVPVAAGPAARSALQEGASALVLDVAGPTSYVVEGHVLDGLARGWTLAVTDAGPVWLEPAE